MYIVIFLLSISSKKNGFFNKMPHVSQQLLSYKKGEERSVVPREGVVIPEA
jgi:hypothetical protein